MASGACLTCGKPVHRSTSICPNCGRRSPTVKDCDEYTDQEKAQKKESIRASASAYRRRKFWELIWGLIKLVLLVTGLMLAFRFCRAQKHSSNDTSSSSIVTPIETPMTMETPNPTVAPEEESSEGLLQSMPQPEVSSEVSSGSTNGDDGFPYEARLIDDRGSVVVQSRPSVFGKNVAKLGIGTKVYASRKEGNWIQVRTEGGDVGYVRKKQLDFTNH